MCLYCGSVFHSDDSCLSKAQAKEIRDKEVKAADAAERRAKGKVSIDLTGTTESTDSTAPKVLSFFPAFPMLYLTRFPTRLFRPTKKQIKPVVLRRFVPLRLLGRIALTSTFLAGSQERGT